MSNTKYVGLSSAERSEIQILWKQGYGHSIRKIAEALGRSPNTISREIRVHSVTDDVTGVRSYNAKKAKVKSPAILPVSLDVTRRNVFLVSRLNT